MKRIRIAAIAVLASALLPLPTITAAQQKLAIKPSKPFSSPAIFHDY